MVAVQSGAEFSRSVSILGATGSIGSSALSVIRQHREKFRVDVLVGGSNLAALVAQAKEFRPKIVALANDDHRQDLQSALEGYDIQVSAGEQAVLDAAAHPADITIAAIAGTAGLLPTHTALQRGGTLALANKECLVCAGQAFMRDAQRFNTTILPLDSEHNALLQALGGEPVSRAERLTLTASGGPFRGWRSADLKHVTPQDALKHPTWTMGLKVTLDSATLMNKGLELIEAHHLFGVNAERLEVLVHPQSIVHGLVSWGDGSVTVGMASPDMQVPIAHCLGYPERLHVAVPRLDLAALGQLTFENVDDAVFPAVNLAFQAMKMAGGATVYNAANEIAVDAFLQGRIGFLGIADCVAECLNAFAGRALLREPASVQEALALHRDVQHTASCYVGQTRKDVVASA